MKTHSIVSFNRPAYALLSGCVQGELRTNQSGPINLHKQSRFAKWASLTIAVAAATTALGQSLVAQAVEYNGPIKTATMWDGMIYKFHRDPDSFKLIVRRAAVPTSPNGQTVWKIPPQGDFSNFGYFINGEISRNSNVGALVSDYPVAQAAPIVVNTGPRDGIDRSMTIMWLRWLGGDKYNAPNRTAWTALTVNKYTANDYESIAFDTYGTGAAPSHDIAAQNQAYRMFEGTPQVGAAALPGGEMVVTANPDRNKARVNLNWWGFKNVQSWQKPGGRSGLTPLVDGIVAVKPPDQVTPNNWNGNVDLALVQTPTKDNSIKFTLWMALRAGNSIWLGGMQKTTKNKVLTVAERQSFNNFTWQQIPLGKKVLRHSLMHVNGAGQGELNMVFNSASTAENVLQVKLPDNPAVTVGAPYIVPNLLTLGRATPDVVTTFGTPPTPLPGQNNFDKDILVDAYDAYINAGNDDIYTGIKIGQALRSKLVKFPQLDKAPIVGIFDGPPPVPNENLAEAPSLIDDTTVASVTYGDKISKSTETTFKSAVGPIVKTEGEAAVPLIGGVEFEGEASALYGSGNASAAEVSLLSLTSQNAKLAVSGQKGKPSYIRPYGQVLLAQISVSAFYYQMLDPTGKPFPNIPTYIQVQPANVQIVSRPFVYNTGPDAKGIVPGQLPSYLVDTQAFDALQQNSALTADDPALASQKYINASWALGNTSVQESAKMNKTTNSTSVDFEGQLLAGGIVGDKTAGNYADMKVGVKTTFSLDEQVGSQKEETLGVEVNEVPYPIQDPAGAYTNYTFSTFKLNGNPIYEEQLKDVLKYDDPAGINKTLSKSIAWGNSPWKVTYAILPGNMTQNAPAVGGTAPENGRATQAVKGATAPSAVPASLQQLGITDPTKVGLLSSALTQMNQNTRIGVKTPRAIQGVPANIVQIASKLTPAQRTDLANYTAQNQARMFQNFLKQHPNWTPRSIVVGGARNTAPNRNAMSTRSVQSAPKTIPAISVEQLTKVTP